MLIMTTSQLGVFDFVIIVVSTVIVVIHANTVNANTSHVIIAEPDEEPKGITCWTCPNKTDNEACNDWAPDRECPANHTVCKTVHLFNTSNKISISVYKICTKETECTHDMVGCQGTSTPHVQRCISCCNRDYCNEAVPVNSSSAIALSFVSNSATCPNTLHRTHVFLAIILSLFVAYVQRTELLLVAEVT